MTRRKCQFSSTEALLSTLFLVLLVVCLGLITTTWLALHPSQGPNGAALRGSLVISKGAVFTEELRNSSTPQYKALAFDVEHLISEVYTRSSLRDQYKSCVVLGFSKGSVVVAFSLNFAQPVGVDEAQQQLVDGVQAGGGGSQGPLVIDANSIKITDEEDITTSRPPSTTYPSTMTPSPNTTHPSTMTPSTNTTHLPSTGQPTSVPVECSAGHRRCDNDQTCIPITRFCDGIHDCPDGSDENEDLCATTCDGQFLLLGPTGSFHSKNFPLPYDEDTVCRWVIRVQKGLSIQIEFQSFDTEEDIDVLYLYEGTGTNKNLTYNLSGSSPGSVWIMSHEATAEFVSDFINNFNGFNATYRGESLSDLTNAEKVNCSFEDGLCFWRQYTTDEGDWLRANGPTFPPFTGPSFDHTLGNQSGYYIVTPGGPGQLERNFRIYSLPLAHTNESLCLSFWYHMYGEDVQSLKVFVENETAVMLIFQKEGNYGDHWNYGQATLNDTMDLMVVFEAKKRRGIRNDIALDDIGLTHGPCVEGVYPEPTPVPIPTTPPPIPSDCGGPFHLWEPNSTFSSPHYPNSYISKATCVWTLHTEAGRNIQLHFLDFDLEAVFDTVEVRDGPEWESELLGVFTGGDATFADVFSTTNQMTVVFFTDSLGYGRGFRANFTSGFGLGQPDPCASGLYQCQSGACISNTSVCDSHPDCPDISDEAHCVQLQSENGTSANKLHLQVQNSWYSVCAENWTSELSSFLCRYLGFRAGNASLVTLSEGDNSFITLSQMPNGTLDLVLSDECAGGKVISLLCDNKPCGTRMVWPKSGHGLSEGAGDEGMEVRGMEGGGTSKENSRVVGGNDTQQGAWPWVVSLHWRGHHACGASLIDKEWLITAAHCAYGRNIHISNWEALIGLHSQYGPESPHTQRLQVDRIIFNKRYNKRTKDSDIAMMHLETQVNFTDYVQPICLPDSDQQFEPGRVCFIAGWGKEAEQGSVADVLQEAALPLVNQNLCQRQLPEYNITSRMVCAGYPEGGVDSCQGDSGGPLMCQQDGHWVLVGVTSFGVGCGRPQRPGVYALVSQFTDWVTEVRRNFSAFCASS
ncbi:enteropeptidase [Megalops cyprinoides]|uniref:enteropeptidase n=1 Tax=Megalops cyprinoides TaxID=118141 RepID=UPI00186549DB|nr:enteropeptidase [Megalops cyprinoides]